MNKYLTKTVHFRNQKKNKIEEDRIVHILLNTTAAEPSPRRLGAHE